jgi:hypothetical protein
VTWAPCKCCGGVKDQPSWYCKACAHEKRIEADLAAAVCGSTSRDHWRTACRECMRIVSASRSDAAKRAITTKRARRPELYRPEGADLSAQRRAFRAVTAAVRSGALPQLDGSVECVDCGRPAKCYEHRDYSRPLDVEPVCVSCNKNRGTAKWPALAAIDS